MAKKEQRGWVLVVVIVVVIAGAAGGGLVLYSLNQTKSPAAPRVVAFQDNVTVNYIGILGSGPQAGRVFDTSLLSVATDNASYPKSLMFGMRAAANYTPLGVHIGPGPPSSWTLGNQTFVVVVTGFWQGLIGLPGNQTTTLTIPPNLGYGPPDPACLVSQPILQTVPAVITLSLAQFSATYPGVTASPGVEFPDPLFAWPNYVLSSNATAVVVVHQPTVGFVSHPYGFPAVVTAISSTPNGTGAISLQNQLTPADAGLVAGVNSATATPCDPQTHGKFIVSAVYPGNNTFIADHNTEVTGQTLLFQVTVVDIFP